MRRVAITGMGIVSSIGNNSQEVLASLREGRSGIVRAEEYAEIGFRCQVHGAPDIDVESMVDRRAMRFHGGGTLLALAWGIVVYLVNPSFFWWLSPILTALVLAVPVSVLTSQLWLGRAARRLGLFLTPEETDPPAELRTLQTYLQQNLANRPAQPGFVRAVVDPRVHQLHLSQIGKPRRVTAGIRQRRQELLDKALQDGPQTLTDRDKRELLGDPASLRALHLAVWQLPAGKPAQQWNLPLFSSTA